MTIMGCDRGGLEEEQNTCGMLEGALFVSA